MANRKCKANRFNGEPCRAWAIRGGMVCRKHGGNSPQARAKAAIRAEVEKWGLTEPDSDPMETMLALASQSRRRADRLAEDLSEAVQQAGGSLAAALTRKSLITTSDGRVVEAAEHVSALYLAESGERDRAMHFNNLCVKAGLHERMVKLNEIRSGIAAELLRLLRDDRALDLSPGQWSEVPRAIERAVAEHADNHWAVDL